MKTLLFVFLFFSGNCFAQSLPVGLYEGLMGNSGVATTGSSAASYYNPSLLRQRVDNAFSLNGNTLGTSNSRNGEQNISSSFGMAPSYLSTIIVGEDLVHELFIATTLQGQFNLQSQDNSKNTFDAELNINRLVAGYSMAFKAIPMALQVLTRYSEVTSFGVAEFADPANNIYSVSKVKTDFKNLNLALGVSSHFRFEHYTLGINFNTRGWNLYNKDEGSAKMFTHGVPNPSDYVITESNSGRASVTNEEGKLTLGHGFRIGNHELLTDSTFVEYSNNLDRYTFVQSFGYRYGATDGHQLLCGIAHSFGPDIHYFGQNFNSSVGYSWITRKLRSAIGIYYSRSDTSLESSSAGFIFGSEYEY